MLLEKRELKLYPALTVAFHPVFKLSLIAPKGAETPPPMSIVNCELLGLRPSSQRPTPQQEGLCWPSSFYTCHESIAVDQLCAKCTSKTACSTLPYPFKYSEHIAIH